MTTPLNASQAIAVKPEVIKNETNVVASAIADYMMGTKDCGHKCIDCVRCKCYVCSIAIRLLSTKVATLPQAFWQ